MNKKTFFLILFLLIIIPLQLLYLFLSSFGYQDNIAGIETKSFFITNSAFLGEYRFSLFGYTSPYAEVTFTGQGIFDKTTSDNTGYFEFVNRFSPFSPQEACLSAKDQFGRISAPICLPSFPTLYNVTIGPVIIPPTVSLDKQLYFVGDEVILTGQTIPNETVNLSMFTDSSKKGLSLFSLNQLIRKVEAYSIPKFTTRSDDKGNFSIALPSQSAQNFRFFTQVNYQDNQSPNSINLKIEVLPIWMMIFRFFGPFWKLIQSRLLELVIFLEIIGLTAYFIRFLYHPYYFSKNKSIILYHPYLPKIEEKHPLVKT